MFDKEKLALESVSTRTKLRKRLDETRSCLVRELKPYFKDYRLDFKNKRAVGINGYSLQWLLRLFPQLPESYKNQQTTIGTVIVDYSIKDDKRRM